MCAEKSLKFETTAVHGSKGFDPLTGAISFPIYQTATFKHGGLNESTGYDYSRLQNPTREEVENTVARLEGAKFGTGFSTGVAAVTAVLSLFKSGDHILVSDDLYGGTFRLFRDIYGPYGIEHDFIDTTELNEIINNIKEKTKAIFIETPSNPMMKVVDINEVVKLAKEKNLIVIVDNTFLTPYFQKPLNLGAHIVVHSGTKFLGGHNDTLAGFVVTNEEWINERIRFYEKSTGATLAPFDSWLILRGIKTLHIRMEKSQENAIKVAEFLKKHHKIKEVFYVGLPEHKGYEVSKKQATGFGSMISFKVRNQEDVAKILKNVKVINFAESLGGVETLITYPQTQTHAEIPAEIKKKLGVTEDLLRLSVGIENISDLIEDLESSLRC
ncbi:trans-sulfuration enzyme family protein [Clostridium folliculivorans]|uniref:Cystathionine gamma-synthase n=1 Tax=Clostridium folliculivorans TaxID=2886038 RepID=A0A9W6DAF1_9CLOT|nr:PLP-dependent aspartate aminotransferase family protein [Clostridium folliculivorans]GKU24901.1 cystathionine gamma-synthase [Clostridium folliculivorans]GKU30999.1 cystathionine gamma-synthase [Clostridium folliculivorans]